MPILMYHSVSAERLGPLAISPQIFRDQLAVLADAGATSVSVSDLVASRRAGVGLPPGAVALTFDDGYLDFAETAFPLLEERGWRATVFLVSGLIDRGEPMATPHGSRRLMTWPLVSELAGAGVSFGAHSLSHPDLTTISHEEAGREVAESGAMIRERAGVAVEGFCPPFGRSTDAIRAEIARHYRWSVGTTMGRVDTASDVYDLPRIEMWYFRNVARWRRYIERGWTPYFGLRRALRALREAV